MNIIDEKSKELYKSIKPDDSLRERILDLENNKSSSQKTIKFINNRKIVSFVASFVIIVVMAIFALNQNNLDFKINGENVGNKPVQISEVSTANFTPDTSENQPQIFVIPLSFNAKDELTLSAKNGELIVSSNKNINSKNQSKKEISFTGSGTILWKLDYSSLENSKISVKYKNKTRNYKLIRNKSGELLLTEN